MAVRYWISESSEDFAVAANWSTVDGTTGLPASGDTLVFSSAGTANVTTNLNQSALTNITLVVEHSYSGQIGTVANGVPTSLQIGATTSRIGVKSGSTSNGSTLLLFDYGATANTTTITDSGSSSGDGDFPPIQLLGTNMTLNVSGGLVGVAPRFGQTATINQLNVSNSEQGQTTQVYLGPGVTIKNLTGVINVSGGTLINMSESATAIAEVNVSGGDYLYRGTATHTLLQVNSGYCEYSGSGTCTTLKTHASIDFSIDGRSKTITNPIEAYPGAAINLANGVPGSIVPVIHWIGCSPGKDNTVLLVPDGTKTTLAAI